MCTWNKAWLAAQFNHNAKYTSEEINSELWLIKLSYIVYNVNKTENLLLMCTTVIY